MPHSPRACLPQPACLGPCEELESSVALLPSFRAGSLHLRPDSGSLRESFAFCVSVCIYVSLFVFVNFLGRRTHSFPPGSRKVSQPFLWRGGSPAPTGKTRAEDPARKRLSHQESPSQRINPPKFRSSLAPMGL